jgi:hypothetical protein
MKKLRDWEKNPLRSKGRRIGGKIIDDRFEKMTAVKTQATFDLELYQQNERIIQLLERIDRRLELKWPLLLIGEEE